MSLAFDNQAFLLVMWAFFVYSIVWKVWLYPSMKFQFIGKMIHSLLDGLGISVDSHLTVHMGIYK